jgi:hypothetical protein
MCISARLGALSYIALVDKMRRHSFALFMLAASAALSCRRPDAPALDLLRPDAKSIDIRGVTHRVLPATAPSRLELNVEVPRGARLSVACGLGEAKEAVAVDFVVKLRQDGRETEVGRRRLTATKASRDRKWRPLDADLAAYAGPAVLSLETHSADADAAAVEAYWGAPVISSPHRKAPLVVVYLVDTLRADHTTPYGYERDTTPELLRF